ncbi:MAG TPA: hypothetical protein ENI95_10365 [Chloroflexi bacterium]|nr:hypothetical protein [Chloroflexota bacterium]
MRRPRGSSLLIALGIMGTLALITYTAIRFASNDRSSLLLLTPVRAASTPGAEDASPSSRTRALLIATAPSATATSLEPGQPTTPSPTPQAAYAGQLQAPVPQHTPLAGGALSEDWNPPPLEVPLARHPFDHYWLIRPVASSHNNAGLSYYPYGSNGPGDNLRIHHGIDLANPIGVEVYAAADGTVIWADRGHFNEYESITAYGNTIVIEHDFGYRGQPVYTLYAHLSALLVTPGQRVQSGQVIGLIGNTGQVSGPHVHFEVRVGRDSYYAVRNPDLWMAPYAGTGTIAGMIALEDGEPLYDAPITLINLATGQVVRRTTTYAGFGVNPDDRWNENFVIPNVPAGHYLVTSHYNDLIWSGEVEVLVGMTNWVDMEHGTAEDEPLPAYLDPEHPEGEESPSAP